MTTLAPSIDAVDVIDQIVPLTPASPTYAVRHQRAKVVTATQASYDGMFSPAVEGISVVERLLVALHTAVLSNDLALAAHYRYRLVAENAGAALVAAVDAGAVDTLEDRRLATLLGFTTKLVERPIEGDRAAVQALVDAGLTTPAIVALGQLIAFLTYQVRVVAGLRAMVAAEVVA